MASSAPASVKALEDAVDMMLSNSFDQVSKECFRTLIKLLDAVLQKPGEPKVRQINLGNPAFHKKVGSRKGGVEFLIACGFERQQQALLQPAPMIIGNNGDSNPPASHLVLSESREDTKHLTTARKLLAVRAVQTLGMKPEELPTLRHIPPPQQQQNSNNTTTFDPYVGFRHDDNNNYVSTTETQLRKLQQRQEQLAAAKVVVDREWMALRPNESLSLLQSTSTTTTTTISSSSSTSGVRGDGALLAAYAKRQQEVANERQNGSLTTKAMRDLEKLKKAKVYNSCLVHFAFPDGHKIIGKFAPTETVSDCREQLLSCLICNTNNSTTASSSFQVDLYVTPPRRLLPLKATLQSEGLVPAAKMFVSFTHGTTPAGATPSYIRADLFRTNITNTNSAVHNNNNTSTSSSSASQGATAATSQITTPAFPTGQAVVQASKKAGAAAASSSAAASKKKPKRNKEDLLRRMMGK